MALYNVFQSAPAPHRLYLTDIPILTGSTMLVVVMFEMFRALFDPRCVRLWTIKSTRRRMATKTPKERHMFFSAPSAPRQIALLLGLAIYFLLLAAAAGVGNIPPALTAASAAVGHARVLPIALFPLAAEWIASHRRRARRGQQRGLA